MKKKALIIFISVFTAVIVLAGLVFSYFLLIKNRFNEYVQALDYSESVQDILNPDQGFYRTARITVNPNSVQDKTNVIKEEFQIYHLRMDISAFSSKVNGEQDLELTQTSLQGIENNIKAFEEAGKNIVIRFSYDKEFDGVKNLEPSMQMILNHIEQLCSVLNKYPLTITAIEAGMIGPWGEMHSSDIATKENINIVINKFLTETQQTKIPVLVRTPQMIYDYLGITLDDIASYKILKSSLAYRLGLFNDGIFGNESDLGTFDDRNAEINWISNQTNHLPYGGEVASESSTYHDIDKCLPEMFKINLSYLNYEWNTYVVQEKWQNQKYNEDCGDDEIYYNKSAYEYIRNHLGYRFVLRKSTFYYSQKQNDLQVKLNLENVGFGSLNREKDLTVYFVKNNEVIGKSYLGKFNGEEEINFTADISSLSGEINVYLAVNSLSSQGQGSYAIQFANNLWNDTLQANLLGKISK